MAYTIPAACTGCTACARQCPVNAIQGQRKQLHVIDPALCIECGVCGKICASQSIQDEKGRMAVRIKPGQWLKPAWNYRSCVECRICVLACPTGSISQASSRNLPAGLKPAYPYLKDSKRCIGCRICERRCPTSAILMQPPRPAASAAAAEDEFIGL
jgi:Na+-translocating ferredoxin:NAD+ oxidoreductase subunit B